MQTSMQAYAVIRDQIVTGRYRPSERLSEASIARLLGISRTPVHDALARIASEGLVTRDPSGGLRVTSLTQEEMNELHDLREALEVLALRYACENPDQQRIEALKQVCEAAQISTSRPNIEHLTELNTKFHMGLTELSRSPRLVGMITSLRDQSRRYRALALYDESEQKQSREEHALLLKYVEERQPARAAELMRLHLTRPRKYLRRMLTAYEPSQLLHQDTSTSTP